MEKLAKMHYYGPWQIPTHCTHVLCSDGKRRYARITDEADTFFSIPACVQVKGKSVSGFITGRETNEKQDYEFIAYSHKKNGHLLPTVEKNTMLGY